MRPPICPTNRQHSDPTQIHLPLSRFHSVGRSVSLLVSWAEKRRKPKVWFSQQSGCSVATSWLRYHEIRGSLVPWRRASLPEKSLPLLALTSGTNLKRGRRNSECECVSSHDGVVFLQPAAARVPEVGAGCFRLPFLFVVAGSSGSTSPVAL